MESRDFTGFVMENTRRNNERQPTHTGKATIGGNEFRVSAWTKTSKKGAPYLSLSFTPEDEVPSTQAAASASSPF